MGKRPLILGPLVSDLLKFNITMLPAIVSQRFSCGNSLGTRLLPDAGPVGYGGEDFLEGGQQS